MDEHLYQHNDNINYLLKRRLSFGLRYGMTFLFLLGIIVLGVLYFVKVPDTLEGRFTLTSSNPPKSLVAKVNGRIMEKFIEDKTTVSSLQTIIQLESVASSETILLLEQQLNKLQQVLDSNWLDSITAIDNHSWQQLGELQQIFEQYKKSNNELCVALASGQYQQEKHIIEKRKSYLNSTRNNLVKQRTIFEREYVLASEAWKADSILGKQNSITQTELRAAESTILQRKLSLSNLQQSFISNETSINEIEQQLLNLEKTILQQKNGFIQSYALLKTAIADWQSKYLVIAPINGSVAYSKNIYKGLQVQAGEQLLSIIPDSSNWIAEIFIPQQNFGKLALNQRCILKFDGYNFEEYGVVDGIVKNISNIPQELKTAEGAQNVYMVQIALNKDIKTSYHKSILPRFGLSGAAIIALDDRSLLEKLFLDKLRALFIYQ